MTPVEQCNSIAAGTVAEISSATPSWRMGWWASSPDHRLVSSNGDEVALPDDASIYQIAGSADVTMVMGLAHQSARLYLLRDGRVSDSADMPEIKWGSRLFSGGGAFGIWTPPDDVRFVDLDDGGIEPGPPVHLSLPSDDPRIAFASEEYQLTAAGIDGISDLLVVWESTSRSPAIRTANANDLATELFRPLEAPSGTGLPAREEIVFQWATHLRVNAGDTIETWTLGMPDITASLALPDGQAIIADALGIHQIGPRGESLWTVDLPASRLTAGPDGSILAASETTISKLSASGAILWTNERAVPAGVADIGVWNGSLMFAGYTRASLGSRGPPSTDHLLEFYDLDDGTLTCRATAPL